RQVHQPAHRIFAYGKNSVVEPQRARVPRLPSQEVSVESLGGRHISGQQLIPAETSVTIIHRSLSRLSLRHRVTHSPCIFMPEITFCALPFAPMSFIKMNGN